jgi:acetyl-CoA carboxylase biotin carboxyl carrier protein
MADTDKKPTSPADAAPGAGESPALSAEASSLLGLIDKLGLLLEKSDLAELEVQAGESTIVLRKPAVPAPAATASGSAASSAEVALAASSPAEPAVPVSAAKAVRAPLTGIYYASSSPSAPPYVAVGQPVTVGQVIGLIEAMKLFNEIKSDASGRVVRIVAEAGKLVKAKQTLIEVEP